jgi:hypothetical protein
MWSDDSKYLDSISEYQMDAKLDRLAESMRKDEAVRAAEISELLDKIVDYAQGGDKTIEETIGERIENTVYHSTLQRSFRELWSWAKALRRDVYNTHSTQ